MRTVIWLILLFIAAVVGAMALGANDGLVSFYWRGWRTDVSLNLFLLLTVLSVAALYSSVSLVRSLLALPGRARQWRATRQERAATQALCEAIVEGAAGRYGRAQRAAQRAIELNATLAAGATASPKGRSSSNEPGRSAGMDAAARLVAALQHHRLQDRLRRDEQLQALRARAVDRRGSGAGVGPVLAEGADLLEAQWALDDRDPERALRLLAALPPGAARRTQALRLKLQAQQLLNQPLPALQTARLLAKHKALSAEAAGVLVRSLAQAALDAARDLDGLQRVWAALDAGERRDLWVSVRAAQRAVVLGSAVQARAWLRPLWDRPERLSAPERAVLAEALLAAVAGIEGDWLETLERAASTFSREPAVQAVAGAALQERQLWGKAQSLLQGAAEAVDAPVALRRQAWLRLARLAEDRGDAAGTADALRQAGRLSGFDLL